MRMIAVLGALVVLAGCSDATGPAKAAVIARLRDPDSVQWQHLRTRTVTDAWGNRSTIVCGQYNAKNGYGGYAGFRDFEYKDGTLFTEGDLTAMMKVDCP